MDRIRAKSYTDSVVDLMVGKLKRLSLPAREAMKQLACLGNVTDVATLTIVYEETEEAAHTALREAVQAGLVLRQESTYTFLHDRIQQAASVFTSARIAVLKLLASQAAISLENAQLYAELTASEERWRKLFESVPVGVALLGSHRRYVAANSALQKMTGYSETELRRLSPVDITYEDDQAATEAIIAANAAGEPFTSRIEKRYRRKDLGGGRVFSRPGSRKRTLPRGCDGHHRTQTCRGGAEGRTGGP